MPARDAPVPVSTDAAPCKRGASPVVWVLAAYGVLYAAYGVTLGARGPGYALAADLAYLPFRMTATAMLALAGRVATHAPIRRRSSSTPSTMPRRTSCSRGVRLTALRGRGGVAIVSAADALVRHSQ